MWGGAAVCVAPVGSGVRPQHTFSFKGESKALKTNAKITPRVKKNGPPVCPSAGRWWVWQLLAWGVCEMWVVAVSHAGVATANSNTLEESAATAVSGGGALEQAGSSTSEGRPSSELLLESLGDMLLSATVPAQVAVLQAAWTAYQQKNLALASQKLALLPGQGPFFDLQLWVKAQVQIALAEVAFSAGDGNRVLKEAGFAEAQLLEVIRSHPYAPFTQAGLQSELAKVAFLLGDGYFKKKNWELAKRQYENGFQRLALHPGLTPDDVAVKRLERYQQALSHTQQSPSDTLGQSWMPYFAHAWRGAKGGGVGQVLRDWIENERERQPVVVLTPTPADTTSDEKERAYHVCLDPDTLAVTAALKAVFTDDFSRGSELLQQFLKNFPRSLHREKARFWLGRTLLNLGETEQAGKMLSDLQQASPLNYYGVLAASLLGLPVNRTIGVNYPAIVRDDPRLLPGERFHLRRAELLLAANGSELAAFELKGLTARANLSSDFLLYLAKLQQGAKNFHLSFSIASDLAQRQAEGVLSTPGLLIVFPRPFQSEITQSAQGSALDPDLLFSLIKQESAFHHQVRSHQGAAGLMQLMPATAAGLVVGPLQPEDLLSPAINTRLGAKYLKQLLTTFQGNTIYALAGFNAGPGAVKRWLKAAPLQQDPLEFIESIPYKETREYVMGIIRNYCWYTRFNGVPLEKKIALFWRP